MKTKRVSHRAGFTLIELLVVITIIAILAAIAFPATNAAIRSAKKAATAAMCSQISTSIVAMNTEYGKWPTPSGSADYQFDDSTKWASLGTALNGNRRPSTNAENTPSPNYNPRGIQFMSFKKKDLELTGSTYKDYPLSPFKGQTEAERLYFVVLDADYNNDIAVPNLKLKSGNMQTGDGVAVYSKTDEPTDQTKWVSSYK
jgi:prepilin-type N-terminal cleavage/methylation domain-containing protein